MTARSQPLAGAPMWAGFLTKNNVYSSKAATASIPRALAGQARLLWEHANGLAISDPVSLEKIPPCAPRNARGLLGEDHSGPPFGREFKHTYFVWSNPDPNDAPNLYTPPPKLERNAGTPPTIVGFDNSILVPVPAAVQGGRYELAQIRFAAYVETAAAASVVNLRLWPDESFGASSQLVQTATTSTGYIEGAFTDFDMVPGKMNRVRVKMSGPSNAATKVHLLALAFSQEN